MKNIHILPTDKPSRLLWSFEDRRYYSVKEEMFFKNQNELQNQNIYITSDEEIKEGDWYINTLDEVVRKNNTINHSYHKKIILTTDQDLIKDGVQAIDDEFLEWFVKNPSCEKVEFKSYKLHFGSTLYKIIIPKDEPKQHLVDMKNHEDSLWEDEPKQETLEQIDQNNPITRGSTALVYKQETLEEVFNIIDDEKCRYSTEESEFWHHYKIGVYDGLKWQQEKSYSQEEVDVLINLLKTTTEYEVLQSFRDKVEQFKKK
jgi:hypothetical protein